VAAEGAWLPATTQPKSFSKSAEIGFIQEVESDFDSAFAQQSLAVYVMTPVTDCDPLAAPSHHSTQLLWGHPQVDLIVRMSVAHCLSDKGGVRAAPKDKLVCTALNPNAMPRQASRGQKENPSRGRRD
jgi:hypothetical protein